MNSIGKLQYLGKLAGGIFLFILPLKPRGEKKRTLLIIYTYLLELLAKCAYYELIGSLVTNSKDLRFSQSLPSDECYREYSEVWKSEEGSVISDLPEPNEFHQQEICFLIENLTNLKYKLVRNLASDFKLSCQIILKNMGSKLNRDEFV